MTEFLVHANLVNRVVTDSDLKLLLPGTDASRYALVNKALQKGELIHLKRGAYLVKHPLITQKITGYYIGCQLVPHSYISFESALSFHQWIPERVNIISCGLLKGRNKLISTPIGQFQYRKIITNPIEALTGVKREMIAGKPALMASPTRAFFDLVQERKLEWQGIHYLTDSLRIEPENLSAFSLNLLETLQLVYRSKKTIAYIKQMKKALYS